MSESEHPGFELELLPVLLALCIWKDKLSHSQCVFDMDNEAARGALIHGAILSENGSILVKNFVSRGMQCQLNVWFAPVPTRCNIQ